MPPFHSHCLWSHTFYYYCTQLCYCYCPLEFFLSSLAAKKPPAPGWSCLESIYLVSASKYKQLSITLTSIQNSNCLLLSSLSWQLGRTSLVDLDLGANNIYVNNCMQCVTLKYFYYFKLCISKSLNLVHVQLLFMLIFISKNCFVGQK